MAQKKKQKPEPIDSFRFHTGRILAGKYEVMELLGAGWEGEVYLVREIHTDIIRTAKFFFPQRNLRDKALLFYARKLHKLHKCHVVIQYHTQEKIILRQQSVSFLISEFVEGELLSVFQKRQPGKKLAPYPAIHLLHAMAEGIECIHALGEYHGDLHSENIIVERFGLKFDLKLLDLFHWGAPSKANIEDDVCNMIRIFYDTLGGAKTYSKLPAEIKAVICGLKRSLILKKFRTAGELKRYLESMELHLT
jgi:serine/threonine protein kinase